MRTLFSIQTRALVDRLQTTASKIRCFLAMGMLALVALLPMQILSQTYTYIDVRQYDFTVTVPNVVLNAGQTVDIVAEVGKPWALANNVVGFRLFFQLSSNAAKPVSLFPNVQNSWLYQQGGLLTESIGGVNLDTYNYVYQRTGKISGSGEILRIRLEAAVNNVSAMGLLLSAGGVTQIENLELRTMNPDSLPAIQIWPNPTKDMLNVHCNEAPVASVQLMSMDGKVLLRTAAIDTVDVSGIASGCYILKVTDQKGNTYHRMVQRE